MNAQVLSNPFYKLQCNKQKTIAQANNYVTMQVGFSLTFHFWINTHFVPCVWHP